ncbi:SMI1/KNR4 family protein [Streptomyces sp. NPDC006510]|uniref:SMI1/KNR4 family protein n=1 Tax=Streptomyces sp. NPDC006510 TaxID=3155600 RepID=UPI0033B2A228
MTRSVHESLAILHGAAGDGTVSVTASGPAPAEVVAKRETGLEPHVGTVNWTAPPSYRAFLASHNALTCQREVDGFWMEFDIVDDEAMVELNADLVHLPEDVGRGDGRLLSTNHLVGFAADGGGEAVWCFDVTRPDVDGEYPVHYHHQDAPAGLARFVDGGAWEFPDEASPAFPSFAAWLSTMTAAFTAPKPPSWVQDLGAPVLRLQGAAR